MLTDDEMKKMIDECFKELENTTKLDSNNGGAHKLEGGKLEEVSQGGFGGSVNFLLEEEADEGFIGAVERVRIRPAVDSGSADHVIHPNELPDDVKIVPNTAGKHFRGANDSMIENFGTCETLLESDRR